MCRAPEHKIARLATVRIVLFYFQKKVSPLPATGRNVPSPISTVRLGGAVSCLSKPVGSGGVMFSVAPLSLIQRLPLQLTVAPVSSTPTDRLQRAYPRGL